MTSFRLTSSLVAAAVALGAGCTEKIPLPDRAFRVDAAADGGGTGVDAPKTGADAAISFPFDAKGPAGIDTRRSDGADNRCFSKPVPLATSKGPIVVFAIDHSASMYAPGFGPDGKSRLGAVKAKLADFLELAKGRAVVAFQSQFPFPTTKPESAECDKGGTCCASKLSPLSFDGINDKSRCEGDAGCVDSPSHLALNAAAEYFDALGADDVSGGARYAVLITDGEPSCEGVSRCSIAQTVIGQMPPEVNVAVVAISDVGEPTPVCLRSLAKPSLFFTAANPTDLDRQFDRLREEVLCELVPASRSDIANFEKGLEVLVGTENIPRDSGHKNGWDVTIEGNIRLYGDACAKFTHANRTVQVRNCILP